MFDSISNIFSLPSARRNKYETKPSFKTHITQHRISKTHQKIENKQPYLQSLIQCLKNPIEEWILHHQAHLKSHIVNKTIYQMVIQNSKRGLLKQDGQMRITVHNLFVLMVQYQILSQFIKQMNTTQLQLLIDGVCGIYLKSTNESIQQLTCVLHHTIIKSRIRKKQLAQQVSIFKPLEIQNIQNFLEIYAKLDTKNQKEFYPIVVRTIPMLSELLKVIVKTNPLPAKYSIIQKIEWIDQISCRLLDFIIQDINQITSKQTHSNQFEGVGFQDALNADLKKKMVEFAVKACKIAGFVSSKELFMYACRDLYFFQHVIKLNKRILEIVHDMQEINRKHQKPVMEFVKFYLQVVLNYDINLPEDHIKSFTSIFKLSDFTYKSQLVDIGLNPQSPLLQGFIQAVEIIESQQKKSSKASQQKIQFPEFLFQKQQTILSYLLRLVFNLQVQYFELLNIVLQKTNKKFIKPLQYYLIKNGLLHFLVEEQQAILGNDRKMQKVYFKMVSNLVKNNPIGYKIFDEILKDSLQQHQRSLFTDEIRKNFYLSKTFLTSILADTLTLNTNKEYPFYFIPYSLQLLLYQQQKSKHDIWISYIHDVILRDLKNTKEKKEKHGKKDEALEKEISQWVTIAIMIQVQYVLFRNGQDIQLGEFTMNYLTNILNEAIKWKYQDETQVMRRILNNYEEWENYYTQVIFSNQSNQDVIEVRLGTTVNFLFLKRWNRKIYNSIKLFIQSVVTTEVGSESLLF